MIVQLKSGAQVVIGECPWVPGVYLSVSPGGAILTPAELDQVHAELGRIAGDIAERAAEKAHRREKAA